MTQSAGESAKKLIQIDVSSDTVCPWCFVGKRNLDRAIAASKDQFNFEVRWHPFLLNPSAPSEGVSKKEYYERKFGSQTDRIVARVSEAYRNLGLEYSISGLTGSSIDSHRLIHFAGQQGGFDKQHDLVDELMLGYFTQGKYIGDRNFLVESAEKVGIEGASEFLDSSDYDVNTINAEIRKHSANITGVPYYVINGKHKLSGAQPPEAFLGAFRSS